MVMNELRTFDPFAQEPFGDSFGRLLRPWKFEAPDSAPAIKIDVSESDTGYTVKAEIPGVHKDKIMKLPLQVRFHGMEPSAAFEAAAQDKAGKLDQFCQDIMACRVDIEQMHKHQNQGRPFGVRVHVTLPGHELTVDRVQHEDAYVALRDAFDGMRRRIEDQVRVMRGDVKQHSAPR
jgi:ribosome-associated translation inhibitor RaiA